MTTLAIVVILIITTPIWASLLLVAWTIVMGVLMWLFGFPIKIKLYDGTEKKYRWFHEIK